MPTNTYVALDKVTVGTATPSITFSSIPQGYTDLVIVTDAGASVVCEVDLRVGNSSVDTGSNYSRTVVSGDGSTATSVRNSSQTYWRPNYNSVYDNANGKSNHIFHFMNYSNTNVFKTMLYRGNSAAYGVDASVNLWRSTSAINIITLYASITSNRNFLSGSTFSLYGIASTTAQGAKAEGGIVTSDANYWYHTFGATSTFRPLQSLTCDYLVVAGGGGGGNTFGGGGGAGGLRSTVGTTGGGGTLESAISVTAQNYTITVGGGGAGGIVSGNRQGTSGTTSTFSTVTSAGGGGGAFDTAGQTGGSGGGGATGSGSGTLTTAGGAGTANQGFGGGRSDGTRISGGGGGGAGVAGSDGLPGTNGGGAGGDGVVISALATTTGTGVNNFYAGGGGGGTFSTFGTAGAGGSGGGGAGGRTGAGTNGIANTGGGGGGGGYTNTEFNGGNGGSGVVIIRYAK